jgi:hypothetical protein
MKPGMTSILIPSSRSARIGGCAPCVRLRKA